MTTRKDSPQNPELPGLKVSDRGPKLCTDVVISRTRSYKGGRELPCGIRFRMWREVQRYSIAKIAARLEDKAREFGMDGQYLTTRLYELEQARFKPPTWLVLLLMQTYQIEFPWEDFLEGPR